MEAAEDSGAVEIEWLPFELRPAPRPLLEVRGDHLRTDWTQNVYRRALAHGRRDPPAALPAALDADPLRVPLGGRAGPAPRRSSTRSTRRSSARARTSRPISRSPALRRERASTRTARSRRRTRPSAERSYRRSAARPRRRACAASRRCSPRAASTTGAWAGSSGCSPASRWSRARSALGRGRLGASAAFGQTFRCSASRAGPRCFSVTATQPQASQATSRSAAFTARRVRAASPAGQSCSSNSRTAQRMVGRSQRPPQTPQDVTPGLSSASSASSRRFALPQATPTTLPAERRGRRRG